MKSILEFELPEDKSEWQAASSGMDWALVVWDLDQQCRNWIKYDKEFANSVDALEGVRAFIFECMEDKSLQFPT